MWKLLIDLGYFIDNVLFYDFDGVQLFLFQGKVVMMLMGIFIVVGFLLNVKLEMGYYCFLIIDLKVLIVEDGLVELLYILIKVKNKVDVYMFFVFVEMFEMGVKFVEGFGLLLVNSKLFELVDLILCIGFWIFVDMKGGVVQFYDCDMIKEMVDEGMKGMQQFFVNFVQFDMVFV